MGRDIKFEIQYLLALTLVVFGLLSVQEFRNVADRRVGILVVILLSAHFALFNLYYAYGEALSFSIDFVERMDSKSNWMLFLSTISFTFFVLHWLFSAIHNTVLIRDLLDCWLGEIFMEYVAPLFIIGLMGFHFRESVDKPLERFRNINIKIFPKEVRIFRVPDDSKPFTVKIGNDSEEPFDYSLEIDIPRPIVLHYDQDEYSGSYSADGTVDPGRAKRRTFELSHDAIERTLDSIEVTVRFEGGKKTEHVEADLVP